MSHECPDCGQTCHCNGDIDDCDYGDVDAQLKCGHYKTPECVSDLDEEDAEN